MKTSSIYTYYEQNETEMLRRLELDKYLNGYKITSKRLFKLEVEIMTAAIIRLNAAGVFVIYVYDALMCAPSDEDLVEKTMNEVALQFGVKTRVKTE